MAVKSPEERRRSKYEANVKYRRSHRQELHEARQRHYLAHKQDINRWRRGHYAANKEKILGQLHAWLLLHPGYHRQEARKYRVELRPRYLRHLLAMTKKQIAALPPETAEALLNAKKELIHAKRTIGKARVQPA